MRAHPRRQPRNHVERRSAIGGPCVVYVNGRVVVDGERVLAADEQGIIDALQAGGERMWPRMREFDWAYRDADELSPQTYPEWR